MSDIKITGKLKLFSKKDYTSEIKKAIKSGTEAEINKMIRKVNKVFNERTRSLENKGLSQLSSSYSAIKKMLYGDTEVKRLTGIAASKLDSIDDKIKYLHTIGQTLNKESFSVGGAKNVADRIRKMFPILEKAYDKGGYEYQASVFDLMMTLKDKAGLDYKYEQFFNSHENEIIEYVDDLKNSSDSIEKFDDLVDKAIASKYGAGYEEFRDMAREFINNLNKNINKNK